MIKLPIKYKDYEGVEREELFYFNLNKAELLTMEMEEDGGLKKHLEKIIQAKDAKAIIAEFKKLIKLSYGVKSPDGKRFMKSDELWLEFEQTEAYSELFIKLAMDSKEAAAFVNGVTGNTASMEEINKAVAEMSTPQIQAAPSQI